MQVYLTNYHAFRVEMVEQGAPEPTDVLLTLEGLVRDNGPLNFFQVPFASRCLVPHAFFCLEGSEGQNHYYKYFKIRQ